MTYAHAHHGAPPSKKIFQNIFVSPLDTKHNDLFTNEQLPRRPLDLRNPPTSSKPERKNFPSSPQTNFSRRTFLKKKYHAITRDIIYFFRGKRDKSSATPFTCSKAANGADRRNEYIIRSFQRLKNGRSSLPFDGLGIRKRKKISDRKKRAKKNRNNRIFFIMLPRRESTLPTSHKIDHILIMLNKSGYIKVCIEIFR